MITTQIFLMFLVNCTVCMCTYCIGFYMGKRSVINSDKRRSEQRREEIIQSIGRGGK